MKKNIIGTLFLIIGVLVLITSYLIIRLWDISGNYSKEQMFNLAELKLRQFIDIYPKVDNRIIEEKYIGIEKNNVMAPMLPPKYLSYEIINDSIEKKDVTDSYVVLRLICKVLLKFEKNKQELYLFTVTFLATELSDPNNISEKEVNDLYYWAIKGEKI